MNFTKDGKGLFLTSDEGTEFQTLRYFATGKQTPLTASITWDMEDMDLSKDGSKLVFSTSEDGYYKLYVLDTKSQQYQPVPNIPKGVIGNSKLNDDN